MLIAGLACAAIAAAIHVVIFYLESIAWTSDRARAIFGLSPQQALATKEMAFNQGFYNLFLALTVVAGLTLRAFGLSSAGLALVVAGTASMAAAAAVLFVTSPDKRGAALKQGLAPLAAIALVALGA